MNIVGIVAEYNPFHTGHLYHLEKTLNELGENAAVVCAMTGDFVQRGDAAAYSKFARAEAACRSGADLVLELPLPWSLSSAEGFARGAVGMLDSLRVVTHLSFGSECGDMEKINAAAEALIDPVMHASIKNELVGGVPYAAARQEALRKVSPELAEILDTPNNILAVEYAKAIYEEGARMTPMTVARHGAGHDGTAENGPKSASEIRHKLAGGVDMSKFIPPDASAVYRREEQAGRGFMSMAELEIAAMSRLRMMDVETFNRLPDAGGGLGNALYKAVREEAGLDAIIARTKSKGYAMSRIRRMVMCAALGVTSGMADGLPPYARVLAVNARGREVLKAAGAVSEVPIITKPADAHNLSSRAESIFTLGADAHDFYVLGHRAREERRGGADWRTGPAVIAR